MTWRPGLPEALSSAGLDSVKLLGHVPNPEQLQSLADGTSFAWIPLPRPESGWAAVDAMVRLAAGQEIDQPQHEVLPIEVWTPDNVPTPVVEYQGPAGYRGPVQGAVGPRRGDRRLDAGHLGRLSPRCGCPGDRRRDTRHHRFRATRER